MEADIAIGADDTGSNTIDPGIKYECEGLTVTDYWLGQDYITVTKQ